jgi:hypothetical protein
VLKAQVSKQGQHQQTLTLALLQVEHAIPGAVPTAPQRRT